MQTREIGRTGIQTSVVALGTWAIGGGEWWGDNDDAVSVKTIETAIDAGINLIDTAPAYEFGHSEEIVGQAIAGKRSQVVLSTKCGLAWDKEEGELHFEQKGVKVYRNLRPDSIRRQLESSLRRLKTDYIDIYHTHWQEINEGHTPIAETMGCLNQLKQEGKIRAIAVSNVDNAQLAEYLRHGEVSAIQPKYSMLDRGFETSLRDACIQGNVSALVYSPLEQGLLTGKITMDEKFDEKSCRNFIPWYKPGKRKLVIDMLAKWDDLLSKYECKMSNLVIAWTLQQPGITAALCGARKPGQVLENAKAGGITLAQEDLERMRRDVEACGNDSVAYGIE